MKEKAIFTLPPSGYRQHRFPPLAQPSAVDEFTAELSWDDAPTQIDVQERLEEGFHGSR